MVVRIHGETCDSSNCETVLLDSRPALKARILSYVTIAITVLGASCLISWGHRDQNLANGEQETPSTWPEALEQYVRKPAYKSVDPNKPLEQQISAFEMAGRSFAIPTVYIQSNINRKQILDGLNLLYVLPDFTSRADFADRQEYEEARTARRFGHMLLEPGAKRIPLDKMVSNMRRSFDKVESAGTFDGLAVEKWYRSKKGKEIFHYEVYLERGDNGRLISWIDCRTKESATFPGCSHYFRDKKLHYKIYYNKENYLKGWREQRKLAISFIDSFEIQQEPTSKSEN